MTKQLSIFDYRPSVGGSIRDVLAGRGWVKARDLIPMLNSSDRQIRAEAEASQGEIVTGNKGYCLISECDTAEAHHAAARLRSQAVKMLARANHIESRLRAFSTTTNHQHLNDIQTTTVCG